MASNERDPTSAAVIATELGLELVTLEALNLSRSGIPQNLEISSHYVLLTDRETTAFTNGEVVIEAMNSIDDECFALQFNDPRLLKISTTVARIACIDIPLDDVGYEWLHV